MKQKALQKIASVFPYVASTKKVNIVRDALGIVVASIMLKKSASKRSGLVQPKANVTFEFGMASGI